MYFYVLHIIYLFVNLFVYLFIYLLIYLFICLFIYLFIHSIIYLFIYFLCFFYILIIYFFASLAAHRGKLKKEKTAHSVQDLWRSLKILLLNSEKSTYSLFTLFLYKKKFRFLIVNFIYFSYFCFLFSIDFLYTHSYVCLIYSLLIFFIFFIVFLNIFCIYFGFSFYSYFLFLFLFSSSFFILSMLNFNYLAHFVFFRSIPSCSVLLHCDELYHILLHRIV